MVNNNQYEICILFMIICFIVLMSAYIGHIISVELSWITYNSLKQNSYNDSYYNEF